MTCRFAQLAQLRHRVQEDVLNEVFHLRPRQPREQHGMNRPGKARVQLAVRIAVPRLCSEHERDVIACRRR